MTNPYQQHSPSNFDSPASGRVPPLNARRPSYASVVSGGPSALARPARSGGFSHLLNPSPNSEQQAHSGYPYSAAHTSMFHADMTYTPNGGSSESAFPIDPLGQAMGSGLWPPRLGSSFPYFSRAFDLYMSKDPSITADPMSTDDVRFPSGAPMPNVSSSGFLAPSYLRGTVYLQKLEGKHRADVLAERERSAAAKAGPTSSSSPAVSRLPSNGSAAHLPPAWTKVPGSSHRGVAYDIVEKPMYPAEEEDDDDGDDAVSPLPSRWNRDDKEAALEVLSDGYEVRHTGRTSSDHEASAVRADHYMSPSCGVYYFEITVLNTRSDKVKNPPIAIGFASKEASISRAPGWEPDSWGYHGDDGHSFASQNVGKPYAEMFGIGDTVGCLVNFRLNHALFTKNGRELPIAFKDIHLKDVKGKLYPIVGLKKKEDHIMANFGQRPFMFDIDGYMKRQRATIEEKIRLANTSALVDGLSETDLIQQLVLQFLQHDGYVETARAFAEELQEEKKALRLTAEEPVPGINIRDDEDAHNRQRIRRAVLEGDIDRAMRYTDTYYPAVLRENEQVYFRLRCRKFIEMIRREAELNMQLEEQRRNSRRGARNEARAGDDDDDGDDEEMLGAGTTTTTGGGQNDHDLDMAMAEDGAGAGGDDAAAAGVSKLSQELLAYGMELRAEFKGDPRRETARQLDEIFSLIAYPNPLKVKEVAHLLDGSGRVAVAEELNSAVLMSLGKSSRAALENVYAQTCVLLEELRKDGGDGAFVTVSSVVEGIPPSRLR
ncbi:SPRY-domain-containing protein [Parathielavia hyrcaniae]|uniref:SPRY-domain-containing protein n=1 Tax=Parathielavia hyrcaniae TaxID=113614 RepID=A0AAN6T4B1_9PEZI|nr:SPRY-domain-containing protein [Parathielavia hyrcaniae]